MKPEKISFNNIKEMLSRDEMKKIIAGSGGVSCYCCDLTHVGTATCSDCEIHCRTHDGVAYGYKEGDC
jgi:hypothetical protein